MDYDGPNASPPTLGDLDDEDEDTNYIRKGKES